MKRVNNLIERLFKIPPGVDHNELAMATHDYLRAAGEANERLLNFVSDQVFANVDKFVSGKWVKTESGVKTYFMDIDKDLEMFIDFFAGADIMLSYSESGSKGGKFHNHRTDTGRWDQHIFVVEGEIHVETKDSEGNIVRRATYKAGTSLMFEPDETHSVRFGPNTKVYTIMFPKL